MKVHISPPPRHLAGLPEDCAVMETVGFRTARVVINRAIADGEIAAVIGAAGLGKSFAVDYHIRRAERPWVWVQVGPAPRAKEVTARLLKALTGSFQPGALYELTDDLVSELREDPHIVVIDDAQNLNRDGLDQVRLLHDQAEGSFPLILVGGEGCLKTLRSDPQLFDRVGGWASFRPIPPPDLYSLLSSYHPFFAATDPELLVNLDDLYAKGVPRRWARLLKTGIHLASKSGTPDRLTTEVAGAALAALQHEVGSE